MDKFIQSFPATVSAMILLLISVIGYQAKATIDNNTKAMERLTCTMENINARVYKNETAIEVHETRLDKGGL